MKTPVADGVARIDFVPSQQEWAATGYDGQAIGLFPTQMAAAKAIGGGFPDALRAALMAEDEAANTKTVRVGVPARFRLPVPSGLVGDVVPVVRHLSPSPLLAGLPDGRIVPVPEPDPEPEPVEPVLAKIVDDEPEPAVFISAASPEAEKMNTGPATPGFVEYWHGRDGWRWCMVVLDHLGGPFATFDEAVADRWRWLR